MSIPKVSICLPTYNNRSTILDTLKSLSHQTYENLEILVRDDCSTDDTVELISSYIADKPRFSLKVNKRNLGIVGNWNRCIRGASGKYICLYHGDDTYEPEMAAEEAGFLEQNPRAAAVFVNGWRFDEQKGRKTKLALPNPLRGKEIFYLNDLLPVFLAVGNFLLCSSAMVRREVYETLGVFDERFTLGEDFEMWLRILYSDKAIGILDKPLMTYRINMRQTSARYHDLRTDLSEHFVILDEFLSRNLTKYEVAPQALKAYKNRRARDLLRCGLHALQRKESSVATSRFKEAVEDTRSVRLSLACYLLLAMRAIGLKRLSELLSRLLLKQFRRDPAA